MAVEMTEGAPKNDNANANGVKDKGKKIIRIQVSKTKKPFFFYLNLAKKFIKQDNDVELCALGMDIMTSTVISKEEKEGRGIPKAKLGILLGKASEMEQSTIENQSTVDTKA
ncbi:uncharacterized protein At2g34160-like isoform X2 [Vigna unguiculata]|uniref:uncharacterized protein At2g34160-like isoform X2 n=1 Tax=Vigna unguiculata TaxID=3917 RepID=UPI001015D8C6|nr:uncharacterized protein At2g34160-like isoform X2 [Vigna unguiculata]